MIYFIELLAIILWTGYVFLIFKSGKNVFEKYMGIAVSCLLVCILEFVNEIVFRKFGAQYSNSILYFPLSMFPVAIVCIGGLFFSLIYNVSERSSKLFLIKNVFKQSVVHFAIFLILSLGCILIELLGLSIGYWKYQNGIAFNYTLVKGCYLFYLCFLVPSFVLQKIISQKRSREGKLYSLP